MKRMGHNVCPKKRRYRVGKLRSQQEWGAFKKPTESLRTQ